MYKNYAYTFMRAVANLRCEFKEAHFPHLLLPSSLFLFLPSLLPLLHSWLKFVMGLIFLGWGLYGGWAPPDPPLCGSLVDPKTVIIKTYPWWKIYKSSACASV